MSREGLVGQLKIDRDGEPPRRRRRGQPSRWPLIVGLALLAVLVVGAGVWFAIARPDLPTVETATAKSAWGGQAQGGALLDASGYVVARREATVSAKVTGKVERVLIQEGQHVRSGQVIATLDDSNARAALDQATAQANAAAAGIRVAQVTLAEQGPKYQRSRTLHHGGWLSDDDLDTAQAGYDSAARTWPWPSARPRRRRRRSRSSGAARTTPPCARRSTGW